MWGRHRQDLARFDDHFERSRDGSILYRPPGAPTGLLVSGKDHADLRDRFVRRHRLDLVIGWLAIAGGAFLGYRNWTFSHSLLEFAIPVSIGLAAAFLLNLKTHLSLLEPLEKERERMAKRAVASRALH